MCHLELLSYGWGPPGGFFPRLEIEVMGLAAASRDLGRRCVYCHQSSRKFDASVDKRASAPAKFGVAPNLRNVVLHVLG